MDVIFNESEMFKRNVGEVEVKKVIDRFEEQHEDIPPMLENGQQIQEQDNKRKVMNTKKKEFCKNLYRRFNLICTSTVGSQIFYAS